MSTLARPLPRLVANFFHALNSSYILALSAFVTTYRRYWSLLALPHYGPAMWMHLTGMILLLVAIPFTAIGCCGGDTGAGRSRNIANNSERRSMNPSAGAYKEARDDPEMGSVGVGAGGSSPGQVNDTSNINETYRS